MSGEPGAELPQATVIETSLTKGAEINIRPSADHSVEIILGNPQLKQKLRIIKGNPDRTNAPYVITDTRFPDNGEDPTAKFIELHEEKETKLGRNHPSPFPGYNLIVSREHLSVTLSKGELRIKDLNSTNGSTIRAHSEDIIHSSPK